MAEWTLPADIVIQSTTAQASTGFDGFVSFFWTERQFQVDRAVVTNINGNTIELDGSHSGQPAKIVLDASHISSLQYPALPD